MIDIRSYRHADAGDLAEVFHDAVHIGAKDHYSSKQREAWCPECPTPEDWARRLSGLETVVAVEKGKPAGFMSMRSDGYLDLAFVRPEVMGMGVADALYSVMLNRALAKGMGALTTQASHPARSFFLRKGWEFLATQTVHKAGVELRNHRLMIDLQNARMV